MAEADAPPPRFRPDFFNGASGGQDPPGVALRDFAQCFGDLARHDPDWTIESAGNRRVRLTRGAWTATGASLHFESGEVSGIIALDGAAGGWVRITASIAGRRVFTGFMEQVWEEHELYPPGTLSRPEGTEAPGRIGKRRTWLILSAAAWPQLAPLANEAGVLMAIVSDQA